MTLPALAITLVVLLNSCATSQTDDRARSIGAQLCAASLADDAPVRSLRTISDKVAIGSSLAGALGTSRPSFMQHCFVQLHHGDGPEPYGDGSASHYLRLSSRGKDVLHVRLRYDPAQDRFAILGFWSAR